MPKEIDIAKLNANENQLGLEPKVIMLTPSYMTNIPEHVINVFDETYIEWADRKDNHDITKYIKENKKVIILRTSDKLFGLLRYAITTPETAEHIKRII